MAKKYNLHGATVLDLDKKKYSRKEVESLITSLSREYEEKLAEKDIRIKELSSENSDYAALVDFFKDKDRAVSLALEKAEEYAENTRKKADMQYILAIETVKKFSAKWSSYFAFLKEKYPMYPAVKNAIDCKDRLIGIVRTEKPQQAIAATESLFNNGTDINVFDPKSKILDYVNGENNGFDMEEVLNPGELSLEELCKEMGLSEESEL